MEVSGQLDAPAALPLKKYLRHQLDSRLGGTQICSERGCEEKNNSCLCRESKPGRSARSLITVMSDLSRHRGYISKDRQTDKPMYISLLVLDHAHVVVTSSRKQQVANYLLHCQGPFTDFCVLSYK